MLPEQTYGEYVLDLCLLCHGLPRRQEDDAADY